MTGTDEHGLKIQETAAKAGIDPRTQCDETTKKFKELFDQAQISYDDYVRTTQERHKETVEWVWRSLYDKGFIYKGMHEGWYCQAEEAFVPEVQLIKDGDGNFVTDLGHPVKWIEEENYKFRLSSFEEPLREWLENNKSAVQPQVRLNEVLSEMEGGLSDLSVSRLRDRIHWALEVPDDPTHSVYVWLDALSVYLTAGGKGDDGQPRVWPAQCQILGKDILRFHAIYWPAFLLALGLPLPRQLHVHAHWTVENKKMSKSLGNVVSPQPLLSDYGVDAVRYFLLREGGTANDTMFSEIQLTSRLNELADVLGNLLSRVTAKALLPEQMCPAYSDPQSIDESLLSDIQSLPTKVDKAFSNCDFQRGIEAIFSTLAESNRYINNTTPWKLKEHDQGRMMSIVAVCQEVLRVCAILLQPVIPGSSARVLDALCVPETERLYEHTLHNCIGQRQGSLITQPAPLFTKLSGKKVVASAPTKQKKTKPKKKKKVKKQES